MGAIRMTNLTTPRPNYGLGGGGICPFSPPVSSIGSPFNVLYSEVFPLEVSPLPVVLPVLVANPNKIAIMN